MGEPDGFASKFSVCWNKKGQKKGKLSDSPDGETLFQIKSEKKLSYSLFSQIASTFPDLAMISQ
jgi:hypothetical protein